MQEIKLPRKHALDWYDRCGGDFDTIYYEETERTITLGLTDEGLADMISDARHYAESMYGEWTDGIDYRPPARTLLAALEKKGLTG